MIREFFAPRFTLVFVALSTIRKWNGVMPVYMSPHRPLPSIDAAVGGK